MYTPFLGFLLWKARVLESELSSVLTREIRGLKFSRLTSQKRWKATAVGALAAGEMQGVRASQDAGQSEVPWDEHQAEGGAQDDGEEERFEVSLRDTSTLSREGGAGDNAPGEMDRTVELQVEDGQQVGRLLHTRSLCPSDATACTALLKGRGLNSPWQRRKPCDFFPNEPFSAASIKNVAWQTCTHQPARRGRAPAQAKTQAVPFCRDQAPMNPSGFEAWIRVEGSTVQSYPGRGTR